MATDLSYLGFRRYKPAIKLIDLIDCYWFINTSSNKLIDSTEYLHPDGGMGIILNYGDALSFDSSPIIEPCILDGTNTVTRELHLVGSIHAIGIRFKIAGASLFLSEPLINLKNETHGLQHVGIKYSSDLYNRLGEAHSDSEKIKIIDDWLLRVIKPDKDVSDAVMVSTKLIRQHGGLVSVKSIADKFNCSQRTIERMYKLQVGMSPKDYSRILKVEYARFFIKNIKAMSFSDIAYKLNYYDQAHFIKQFKSVVGVTPGKYHLKKTQ